MPPHSCCHSSRTAHPLILICLQLHSRPHSPCLKLLVLFRPSVCHLPAGSEKKSSSSPSSALNIGSDVGLWSCMNGFTLSSCSLLLLNYNCYYCYRFCLHLPVSPSLSPVPLTRSGQLAAHPRIWVCLTVLPR